MRKNYTPNDIRALAKQSGPQWESEVRAALVFAADLLDAADAAVKSTQPAQAVTQKSGDAHEIWAAAQLVPGEGIADGVARVEALLDAPEQEPVGWLIDGGWMFLRGEFAEMDAKAEAARCGGTCKAFPVYTQPQPVAELPDAEIDDAWRSVDYTVPYEQFKIDIARAVLAAQRGKA